MSYLEVKNLKKIWNENTEHEVVALSDMSFSMDKGDFITIVGSNASGKSTLFGMITGSITPTAGEIFLEGKNITKTPEYERTLKISKVKQDPNQSLISGLSVVENFALALKRGSRKTLNLAVTEKVKSLCREKLSSLNLGIEKRIESDVSLFSGGQRQAVALVSATLNNPELLLLDEHTAALDPKTSHKILELTDKIVREQNITTLMITHNITNALQYGNRIIVLENGKIKFDASGEQKKKLTVENVISLIEKPIDLEEEF